VKALAPRFVEQLHSPTTTGSPASEYCELLRVVAQILAASCCHDSGPSQL
jgi:hypothetical protein